MHKYFGDKNFYKRVLKIMLPIMAQQGITNLVSLLDNIMVGQVGTEQMSGVAISNQLLFVFQLCLFGILSGAGIFCAQYFGRGDYEKVQSVFRFKLISTAIITAIVIVLFAFEGKFLISLFLTDTGNTASIEATLAYGYEYLLIMLIGMVPFAAVQLYSSTMRETGETVIPMRAGIVAIVVNISFNYVLIFGHFGAPALGVSGAAIATVISRFAEFAVVVMFTKIQREKFHYFVGMYKTLRIPKALVIEIMKKAMPLLANEFLWSVGTTFMVQCYSTCGLNAIAAYNISSTVTNLFFIAAMAMGNSIGIILGHELGSGRLEKAVDTARKLNTMAVVICLIVAAIMAVTAPLFPRIYNTSEEVRNLASHILMIDACFLTFRGIYNCAYFTLRSGGKSFLTFLFDSCSMWVIYIPIALILSRKIGMDLLPMYLCIQLLDIAKSAVGLILVKKRIWVNNLTELLNE